MKDVKLTRDLFLWCMSATYFFAFASIYLQIPGLYGDNGILPVKLVLKNASRPANELLADNPTLLWFYSQIGLDPQLTLELVALLGAVVALFSTLSGRLRSTLTFAILWILYLSIENVGQTFLWFQWDILLLEAGFLTILVAPLNLFPWRPPSAHAHDGINLWLIRWLLFRLMFASGVVKLTSQCPTWWGLTALNHHFESQCIPTFIAWYAHHLPEWVLRLGVVATYVIEIALPFLFFSPTRSLRIFSFYVQVLLQVAIMITGNYNFFNFLTIALCFALLDDNYFHAEPIAPKKRNAKRAPVRRNTLLQTFQNSLSRFFTFIVFSAIAYWTVALFNLQFKPDFSIDSKIAFTSQEFNNAVEKSVQVSIYIGAVSLGLTILSAIYYSFTEMKGLLQKLWSTFGCVVFGAIAIWFFTISLVPHSFVNPVVYNQIFPVVKSWHHQVEKYHVVNSYGLFRRMTGIGGRPELIVEGANTLTGDWSEYHFLYKPSDINGRPPIVAPHQPRLDWQMWFAALGTHSENPWFVSFVNKLLHGQSEVLNLLDKQRNPFPKAPPKYIRVGKYTYNFSDWKNVQNAQNWWEKKKVGEYLPAVSKDDPSFLALLKAARLVEEKSSQIKVKNIRLKRVLTGVRQLTANLDAPTILWSIFLAALVSRVVSPSRNHLRP